MFSFFRILRKISSKNAACLVFSLARRVSRQDACQRRGWYLEVSWWRLGRFRACLVLHGLTRFPETAMTLAAIGLFSADRKDGKDRSVGLAFETEGRGAARLGLIVLQADETIENEFRRIMPFDVDLYVSRVPSGRDVTPDSLADMENHIGSSARLLPPSVPFDVIGYGCTSGTSVIGTERVGELVRSGASTKVVAEPISALIAASWHFGVTRLAFLSPYIENVSSAMRSVLAANGIETPVFGSFETSEEAVVAGISPVSIMEAAVRLGSSAEAEAVFISCTNLRTLDIISTIEDRLGKPVFASNQVLAWHMCRLAGVEAEGRGFGKLLSRQRQSTLKGSGRA
jgi:maleate isomerase